ncbi:hypothetical protein, partial [Polaromonas sp. P5_E6]
QPEVLVPAGVKNNSPAAQTSFCPDPSGPALLGASTRANRERGLKAENKRQIPTRTRHGESLFLVVFGVLSLAVWVFGFGIPLPTPFCLRRGAQIQADQGSRLSERSEFERDPAWTEHRRLPVAQRRVADSRVAFSFAYFSFGEAKEK